MNFLRVMISLIVEIDKTFYPFFLISVYEETAGLMVNDPVLRTHKVSCYADFSISMD